MTDSKLNVNKVEDTFQECQHYKKLENKLNAMRNLERSESKNEDEECFRVCETQVHIGAPLKDLN